ncbi:uncharacterized protein TRIVIDRAFT_216436 [Trichoderma virens Gv29-8]|uniref:Uncharacterized protein n=1 Tax=Hypocrea virens (strain Gv29-8 / FGSC 10586) TaxID=413071 RepID=G9MZR0_HYPVG|nr:uncharacterized protein TRIVIDRAFT_216436 [Trichoderma virens Gv29-8]EHK20116.1 hypothetical protein TRIVIDRAFT_216436 [Trichoderma virens Gv29-8]
MERYGALWSLFVWGSRRRFVLGRRGQVHSRSRASTQPSTAGVARALRGSRLSGSRCSMGVSEIPAGYLPCGAVATSQYSSQPGRYMGTQAGTSTIRPGMAVDRRPDRDRTRGTRWPRFPHFSKDRHSPRQNMTGMCLYLWP